MKINYEDKLNTDQFEVVQNADGYSLVLSGPGSGKTRVLVYRVAYLLEQGVDPENILLLTFTKKAANEMLDKVESLVGISGERVMGGTFHHVGNFYLRQYADKLNVDTNYTILDQKDSQDLIKVILDEKDSDGELPSASILQKIISLAKNSNKPVKKIIKNRIQSNIAQIENIKNLKRDYKNRKAENNLMDFDDLLLHWLELLKQKEIRQKISKKFQYILVDEYQDTNTIQDKLLEKLSSYHNNLMVVGDESQSIYSFRAAEIKNILNFPDKYPDSTIFKLETNYRSTPEILDIANYIIKKNNSRLDKSLKSVKDSGTNPVLASPSTQKEQSRFVVNKLQHLVQDGDYSDSAVLFRAHYHAAGLELELTKNDIPYIVRGGTRFFEQAHIKDLSAFLKLIVNYKDEPSWLRVLQKQKGVGDAYSKRVVDSVVEYENLQQVLKDKNVIASQVPSRLQSKIKEIFDILDQVYHKKENDLSKSIKFLIQEWYEDTLNEEYDNPKERKEDIQQVMEISHEYDDMEEMLADFALSEEFNSRKTDKTKALTLSTVHQAKGLEWKNVFIIGLREKQFPHKKSVEEGLIEEERRLFYVAVTRCKKNLFLTYPVFTQRGQSCSPSRFLQEIEDYLEEDWQSEETEVIDEDDFEFF